MYKYKISAFNDISNVNIDKMVHIFNTLYDTRSITKTAQLCFKTKSTISRSLSLLENIIGEKLFVRNGCRGLSLTEAGERFYFYSKQITELHKSLSEHFSYDNNNNVINICLHPLGIEYILTLDSLKNRSVNLFIENRSSAMNNLFSNKYDLIFFPYENTELSKINTLVFYIDVIKPYNLCLFLNKQNTYAEVDEKDIDWHTFNNMHIVPIDNEISFNSYIPILSKKNKCLNISSLDLNLIKYGVLKDLWIAALGEEFKKLFIHKDVAVKELRKCNHIYQHIYWCVCCKNNALNKLQDIILELKQKYSIS